MPSEDYQPPFCFECDGEVLKSEHLLVCNECGKIYTQDEYQKLTDEEAGWQSVDRTTMSKKLAHLTNTFSF